MVDTMTDRCTGSPNAAVAMPHHHEFVVRELNSQSRSPTTTPHGPRCVFIGRSHHEGWWWARLWGQSGVDAKTGTASNAEKFSQLTRPPWGRRHPNHAEIGSETHRNGGKASSRPGHPPASDGSFSRQRPNRIEGATQLRLDDPQHQQLGGPVVMIGREQFGQANQRRIEPIVFEIH